MSAPSASPSALCDDQNVAGVPLNLLDEWEESVVSLNRPQATKRRSSPSLGLAALIASFFLALVVVMVCWGIMDAFATKAYLTMAGEIDTALVRDVTNTLFLFTHAALSATGSLRDSVEQSFRYGQATDSRLINNVVPLVARDRLSALYVGLPNGRLIGYEVGPPGTLIQVLSNTSLSGELVVSLADLKGQVAPGMAPLAVVPGYNATSRDWYQLMATDPKSWLPGAWTRQYVSAGTPYSSISYSVGVVCQGALDAVCGCDISTEAISRFLFSSTVGTSQRGALWVYSSRGYFVATGNSTILGELVNGELFQMSRFQNLVVREVMASIVGADVDEQSYERTPTFALHRIRLSTGEEWFVTNQPLANQLSQQLTLVIATPVSDYFEEAEYARNLGLAVSLGVLVPVAAAIMALAAFFFIALPLKNSERSLDHMASDLEFRTEPRASRRCCSAYSNIWEIGKIQRADDRLNVGLGSFAKYVPMTLLRRLLAQKQVARLGVVNTEATALFGDVVDLEHILSTIDNLKYSILILREYFVVMSGAIEKNGGTLGDFIGSLVFGFWNAMHPVVDHAAKACEAALKQQQGLVALRARLRPRNLPEIFVHTGLDTGDVLAGNIGSSTRFKFTIVGDHVNTASRLSKLNQRYGTSIIISERTWNQPKVPDAFVVRVLDIVAVKGKKEGVVLLELLGRRHEAEKWMLDIEIMSRSWLDLYLLQEWSESIAILREMEKLIQKHRPDDVDPAIGVRLIIDRIEQYQKVGVSAAWTGVHAMQSK